MAEEELAPEVEEAEAPEIEEVEELPEIDPAEAQTPLPEEVEPEEEAPPEEDAPEETEEPASPNEPDEPAAEEDEEEGIPEEDLPGIITALSEDKFKKLQNAWVTAGKPNRLSAFGTTFLVVDQGAKFVDQGAQGGMGDYGSLSTGRMRN
jgi:hypothetical protein